jgi:hypothetical protein
MSERYIRTVFALDGWIAPLLVLSGLSALLVAAMIVGQIVIYGGW